MTATTIPRAKVPEITIMFWVTKILTTAMGEATSDFLAGRFDPYIAVVATGLVFLAALAWQFSRPKYEPWPYWILVVMISIFGTMIADSIHIVLGIPYAVTTPAFALMLAAVILLWQRSEGSLSIHSIRTRRREAFYWATVIATFALGTAAGDFTALSLHLGFLTSAILFSVLFAIPGILYGAAGLNAIVGFWSSYILTRPVGASFADWFDKPTAAGGLGYGNGPVAAVLTVLTLAAIGWIALAHRRTRSAHGAVELSR